MLFDMAASDIVTHSASTILGGSYDEIVDLDNIPDALQNLKGKSYQFIVGVEKENLFNGLYTYKVFKVLSTNGMLSEQNALEDSENSDHPMSIISGNQSDQTIVGSQESNDEATPSSKHGLDVKDICTDQSSSTKRLKLDSIDLDASDDDKTGKTRNGKGKGLQSGCLTKEVKKNDKGVMIKVEPKDR
ncbi:hypothetical protein V5N11_016539 [Cardamine amara subsp. amara]|uniref:Uncharacterized protein n=1 Tax=Cardamine amara subsp. amara TaxID=228776 RepID=A0ABD1APW9_CARAN